MPPRIARTAALTIGALLVLWGAGGYVDKLVNGSDALLPTDFWEDIGHLVLGAGLLLAGVKGEQTASYALRMSALLLIGFAATAYYDLGNLDRGYVFGRLMRVAKLTCYIHVGVGVAQLAGAMMNTSRRQLFYE